MKTIAIFNQKGGVGKTTTAVNLAAGLARKRLRTLLVDLDPQANASSALGIAKEPGRSLYGPLHAEGSAADRIIATDIKNLFMIPSETDLAAIETELGQQKDYLLKLKTCLKPLENQNFQVLILDCPPSLGMLSMNGLVAAQHLIVPLQCEYLAMEGLGPVLQVIEQLKNSGLNPQLELMGIIMTMFDVRTRLSRQVVSEVDKHLEGKRFKTLIPRSIRLSEAPSFGQSIFDYDSISSGALAYKAFAQEVVALL